MNLNDFLIKSSRKDPQNGVYKINDKIFRAISDRTLDLLKDKKAIANNFPLIKGKYEFEFKPILFEIEYIPFIVYPYELPFNLFKDYALFYLDLLESLLSGDFSLSDASPFNICYIGNKKFLHFDLGSLENHDQTKGWKGYRQFLSEFYFPLLFLSEQNGIYYTDLVKLQFDKQWIYHYKFKFRNFLNLGFVIHYSFYKSSRVKSLHKKENRSILKINLIKNNLVLLREHIKSLSLKKIKTKWDNYYPETVIHQEYVDSKEQTLRIFLKKIINSDEVKFIVDWGANDGKFSEIILNELNKSTVISVESDYNAINQLYLKSKDKRIIPVYADILNLTAAKGFEGERESLKDRLKKVSDFQVCLGLIHHLIHQENLSFSHIINFLAGCAKSKSYLLIEFINEYDPRHQLIKNPNYPYLLNRDSFIKALNEQYEILDSKAVLDTRELFFCIKRS